MTPTLFWQKVNAYCEAQEIDFSQIAKSIKEKTKSTNSLYSYRTRNRYPTNATLGYFVEIVGVDCVYEVAMEKMEHGPSGSSCQSLEQLTLALRPQISKETREKQRLRRRLKKQSGIF
ncbi:DUF7339 family protein [Lactococcus taiwanensis]|uniref:DUF7339 family protein n=1 Tax=Lactococcus taiwanensis TaxID=1151742 RepID=UPI0035130513